MPLIAAWVRLLALPLSLPTPALALALLTGLAPAAATCSGVAALLCFGCWVENLRHIPATKAFQQIFTSLSSK